MKRLLQISFIVLFSLCIIPLSDSCKKKPTPPIVTTSEVTEITRTTAATGGNVLSDGGAEIIVAGICWNTSPGVSVRNKHTNDGRDLGSFSTVLTGLSPGTTYYIIAYAHNSAGTGYGKEISFTTDPVVGATVTTAEVTSITTNSAISGGDITDDGGAPITARGVCWSTSQNPTIEDYITSDGEGSGTFASDMTDLAPNTTYYVRAYATNSSGTSYGNEVIFTTLGQAPTAITEPASNITDTGATLNGRVNANYLSATVTFEYGTTTSYGSSVTASPNPVTGNTETSVNAGISGLIPGTTYHFRVKAVNSVGTTYGNDLEFTTLSTVLPANGLVAYYPFNGNANDQSVNGNNGTVDGATLTTDRFGKTNSAYYFDGINDLIEVPNSTSLNPASLSISLWIQRNCDGVGLFDGILSKCNGGEQGYLVAMDDQNYLGFWIRSNTGDNFRKIHGNSTVQKNIWLHVATTFDNGEMKLYINGQIQSQSVNDAVLVNNANFLTIGSYAEGLSPANYSYFKGIIDDIRIYNKALSADEILLLYNETP